MQMLGKLLMKMLRIYFRVINKMWMKLKGQKKMSASLIKIRIY